MSPEGPYTEGLDPKAMFKAQFQRFQSMTASYKAEYRGTYERQREREKERNRDTETEYLH
jgi:hypothetical protein